MMRGVAEMLLVAPVTLFAQSIRVNALDSLAAAAATGTARFADRRVAAAEGYRRLGADFPGMGEHWLHPGALLSGQLDAKRPTILIYATIAGEPALLGVGFVTTTRGRGVAEGVPGWPDAWHEHSGLLADESGVSPGTSAPSDTHVWILHTWTTLANPGGIFSPDNWALPFVRAKLAVPARADADAARAVALLNGGDDYLRDVLTDAAILTPVNAAVVDSIIARVRGGVGAIVATPRTTKALSADELMALRTQWQSLSTSLHALLGSGVDRYLAPPHASPREGHHHQSNAASREAIGTLPRLP